MGLFKLVRDLIFPYFDDSLRDRDDSLVTVDSPPESRNLSESLNANRQKDQDDDSIRLFPKRHVHPHGYVQFAAGMDPYPIIKLNPTLMDCIRIFGVYEYGIMMLTSYIPAYLVYRDNNKNLKIKGVWVGALVGLGFGFIYGLMHSYSRLAGFMPFDTNNVQWINEYDISKGNYNSNNAK